jgi:hypothetical protein
MTMVQLIGESRFTVTELYEFAVGCIGYNWKLKHYASISNLCIYYIFEKLKKKMNRPNFYALNLNTTCNEEVDCLRCSNNPSPTSLSCLRVEWKCIVALCYFGGSHIRAEVQIIGSVYEH